MMIDRMNQKNFGILDESGNQVAAGAAFMYRGFIISMSQLYTSRPEVVVFLDGDIPEIMTEVRSVEYAINWCNQNQDKKY